MGKVRGFLIAVGIWYVLNLVLTWPSVYATLLPALYPGADLHQGEPVFRLLLEAWVIVGIQLAAIGVVALWGARRPLDYLAVIPVVVVTEIVDGIWDIYSITMSLEAPTAGLTTLFIHAVIIAAAVPAWKAGQAELARLPGRM
jgi:hypothetical protein